MKKIVIVMTYYNRELQLFETIKSIGKTSHSNYDIVIVDDCSDNGVNYDSLKKLINKNSQIHIIKITKEEKFWNNPVIVYNMGFLRAFELDPEIIIIQNPESYHIGDILMYSNDNITNNTYISYGCFSLNKEDTFNNIGNYELIIDDIISLNNHTARIDCETAWYNHPQHRPVGYEFCSAISTENLKKLNGYDERFAKCISYGDDDLKLRIERLELPIKITKYPEEPIVIHQYHEHNYIDESKRQECNQNGFNMLQYIKQNEVGNYKGKHIKTNNF